MGRPGRSTKIHEHPKVKMQLAAMSLFERSSEGASTSVAGLGRGWYFGGHLDGYTTQGWSQSVPRVYLDSMIEYTFPGDTNDALSSGDDAGSDGAWRNITEATGDAGFPERADGILAWIPGFSKQGILVALAGGTSKRFVSASISGSPYTRSNAQADPNET